MPPKEKGSHQPSYRSVIYNCNLSVRCVRINSGINMAVVLSHYLIRLKAHEI